MYHVPAEVGMFICALEYRCNSLCDLFCVSIPKYNFQPWPTLDPSTKFHEISGLLCCLGFWDGVLSLSKTRACATERIITIQQERKMS